MLSSKQRNQDFFYKPDDPEWSIRRGMDRARTVMGLALGAWSLTPLLNFFTPEPRGDGITIALGLLGLVGFGLLLVAGSVVLFNTPKSATPVKFRHDQSPVGHFLRGRGSE
ncbi:MAG TPA: hypothetical protein VFY98_08330 [Intrasporangium sp.]|nr:hypothetical protein [Intrasporangium sp.]